MREPFDALSYQALGIFKVEHVRDRSQIVLMGFVDGCSVKFRRQLFLRMVSIVDPNLHEVGTVRSQIAHGLPGLFGASQAIRQDIGAPILGPNQARMNGARDAAAAALGEEAFRAAYQAGLRMSAEQAVALAKDGSWPPTTLGKPG